MSAILALFSPAPTALPSPSQARSWDECCPWRSFSPASQPAPVPPQPPAGMSTVLGALAPRPQLCLGPLCVLPLHSELSSDSHPAKPGILFQVLAETRSKRVSVQQPAITRMWRGLKRNAWNREWERGALRLELFLESLRAGNSEPKATINRWAAAQSPVAPDRKVPWCVHRTGSFTDSSANTNSLLSYQPLNCLSVATA